jgi:hypothetical protein
MDAFMTSWLGTSWRSTLGGLIAALPQLITAAALGSGITLSKWVTFAGLLVTGIGTIIGFSNTKDKQVHSLPAQSAAAQAAVEGNPNAPAMMKAANQQAEEAVPATKPLEVKP